MLIQASVFAAAVLALILLEMIERRRCETIRDPMCIRLQKRMSGVTG
jgi:hypothetical protein